MTPLQREALQMCLEYIETDEHERRHVRWKIQEALAEQQAQTDWEAVAADQAMTIGLLKAVQPEQRKPLTDEEIDELRSGYQSGRIGSFVALARAIEAAHGIKENT